MDFAQNQLKQRPIVYPTSSTQFNIPDPLALDIYEFSLHNISDDMLAENMLWMPRDKNPHVTVKWALQTETADGMQKLLDSVKPFEIKLGLFSIFAGGDRLHYDTVKIDVESDELVQLHHLIGNNFASNDPYPSFIPHSSVAFVKNGLGQQFVGNDAFFGRTALCSSIMFSNKYGDKTMLYLKG